jgi:DNA-binding XRE family transcriptional regulator
MNTRPSTLRGRIRRQTRLGEMFRLYRTVHGLSLRSMAPQIDISYATLMRIEHGQAFDADTLLKLWTWMLSEDTSG